MRKKQTTNKHSNSEWVNMVLDDHSRKPWGLLGTGGRGYGDGGRGRLYTYRYWRGCHHQNDICIKMGRDETILMFHNCEGQSQKTLSTDHNFWRERRAEADSNRGPAYQPKALPLGQTGSHHNNKQKAIIYTLRKQPHPCSHTKLHNINYSLTGAM